MKLFFRFFIFIPLISLLWQTPLVTASDELSLLDIKLSNVALISLNSDGAVIAIDLDVYNPSPRDIVVEAIHYRLRLNQIEVKKGFIQQQELLSAGARRVVRVPVPVSYDEQFPSILAALNSSAPSSYEISGTVKVKDRTTPVPFQHKGQLAAPQPANSVEKISTTIR